MLPNLLRAGEALQDRVVREREHVAALRVQLDELRASEARTYSGFLQAEDDYQKRLADLTGVQADARAAEAELARWRERLQAARMQLDAVRTQLSGLYRELARVQAALEVGWARLGALLAAAGGGRPGAGLEKGPAEVPAEGDAAGGDDDG